MTPTELATERQHIIQTRLAILCGAGQPTREQFNIAIREADEWEARFKLKQWEQDQCPKS